jgi:dual specificity phosphatase 12
MDNIKEKVIKVNDNIFYCSEENFQEEILKKNNIKNIFLIDKYLEINSKFEKEENREKYQIFNLEMNSEEPNENFLFRFNFIYERIKENPSLMISFSENSSLIQALIIAYFITDGKNFEDSYKILNNSNNLFEEQKLKLIDYDKHINMKNPEFIYKCGRCRKTLFSDKNIMFLHEFTPKEKYSHKRRKNNQVRTNECTSYFLNNIIDENDNIMKMNQNSILCLKCNYKLGEFWPKGTQCSCGSWVVPAVQIVKSKVDKVKNL